MRCCTERGRRSFTVRALERDMTDYGWQCAVGSSAVPGVGVQLIHLFLPPPRRNCALSGL
jgi:hypothetical protein